MPPTLTLRPPRQDATDAEPTQTACPLGTHLQTLTQSHPSRLTLGPCPCPRDTFSNFLENFMSSASFSRSAMGSAPGDSTKMRGMALLLSLKAEASSKGGGSMN